MKLQLKKGNQSMMDEATTNYAWYRVRDRFAKYSEFASVGMELPEAKKIAFVMHILYLQPKLTGDDMRDLAQILNYVLDNTSISE